MTILVRIKIAEIAFAYHTIGKCNDLLEYLVEDLQACSKHRIPIYLSAQKSALQTLNKVDTTKSDMVDWFNIHHRECQAIIENSKDALTGARQLFNQEKH